MSKQTIYSLESGRQTDVTVSTLESLSSALKVRILELLGELSKDEEIVLKHFHSLDELKQAFYLWKWSGDSAREKAFEALMEEATTDPSKISLSESEPASSKKHRD